MIKRDGKRVFEIARQVGIIWLKSEKMLLIWVGSDGVEKNQSEEWICNSVHAQSQYGIWNIILKNYSCKLAKLENVKSQIFQLQ